VSDTLIAAALRDALAALGADTGTVHVRAPGQRLLRYAAHAGFLPPPVLQVIQEIPFGKGMAGVAAERVEPVGTCNLQTTQAPEVRPGAKQTQLQGALVVPMLLGDEVAGTFGVGCKGERIFTRRETDELWERARLLARQIAAPPLEALRAALAPHLSPDGREWLDAQLARAQAGERAAVVEAFPAVSRRLGRGPLGDRGALASASGDEVPLRGWRIDDAGRAALVCAFGGGDREALARELYFGGDLREQAGALRALAVVGTGEAACDAVLDAMRVAATELVEAALADNPYSARVLPDLEFKKAVLKCAFVGISLDRVQGLPARADEELTGMLLSYVTEREIAGRAVPADVWPPMGAAPLPGLTAKLLGYLQHPSETHRAAAARALGRAADPRARPFLEERFAVERDDGARRAIAWALS
jgi:hypothetical protein